MPADEEEWFAGSPSHGWAEETAEDDDEDEDERRRPEATENDYLSEDYYEQPQENAV